MFETVDAVCRRDLVGIRQRCQLTPGIGQGPEVSIGRTPAADSRLVFLPRRIRISCMLGFFGERIVGAAIVQPTGTLVLIDTFVQ